MIEGEDEVQPLQVDNPKQVGEYVLAGRLGSGAMGAVYLGWSRGGRPVAVKVAKSELADDAGFRERFRREVEMARSVGGFWTAAVIDADPDAPRPWMATEYVPGPTLHQAVQTSGPLPEEAVRKLAAGLAEALCAIHGAGLVHRDLKPSNVLLGADGPRVIDFGIARALEHTGLTETGAFFGTPGFLSPEQIVGSEVGPRSDVFALGAIIVFAASARGPWGDGNTNALLYRAVHAEPELGDLPPGLRAVAAACLERDPARRPDPAQVLRLLGSPGGTAQQDWLPAPVKTLVEQRHTELKASVPKPGTLRVPTGPERTPLQVGNGVRFRTSRAAQLRWGSVCLAVAALAVGAVAEQGPLRLYEQAVFLGVLLALVGGAARFLVPALRPRRTLAVSREGLVVSEGGQRSQLWWYSIARVRVVPHQTRPWLVVWLAEGAAPPAQLGDRPFGRHHGGLRLFPIAHDEHPSLRDRHVEELRAALSWNLPHSYDPS